MTKNIFIFLKIILVAWLYLSVNITNGQVITFPSPTGLIPSTDYQVKVNGKEVFVYGSPIPASYCIFDMSGPVDISIITKRDLKWVDVRPFSAGIKPIFKDSIINIHLTKPGKLSIELNGSIKSPLFIFAGAPEIEKPSSKDKDVIFFEGGKLHYAGEITLKSNQTLYIAGGAVVIGNVKSINAKNIKIKGRGILDGFYNRTFNDSIIKLKNPALIGLNNYKVKYHRSLELTDCENVTIEGITLHNSTSWQVVPLHCNKVKIENIKIVSDQPSDDGIDIDRSKNVSVSNCFIRTKDDCIAVKSDSDYPFNEIVDSITVEKCVFWNAQWGNGFEIGFELNSSEVKNITFRNSDLIHVEAGAALSIHNAGKATVSNILFENIRIENPGKKLFDLAIFRSQYSDDGKRDASLYLHGAWDGVLKVPVDKIEYHSQFRGKIRNVTFKNISVIDGNFPFSIFNGYNEEKNIDGVNIENLKINGRKINNATEGKFFMEKVKNIIVK